MRTATRKTKTINVPASLHQRLKLYAAKHDIKLKKLVIETVEIGLAVKESKK